jgi:glycerate kinase
VTQVIVDADALNSLLSAVESDMRLHNLVAAVRASVRSIPTPVLNGREKLVQSIRSRSK